MSRPIDIAGLRDELDPVHLGQRRDVRADGGQDVAGDVERPVLRRDLFGRDHPRPVLHVPEPAHPPDDALRVLRVEEVLRAALAEEARGVDRSRSASP